MKKTLTVITGLLVALVVVAIYTVLSKDPEPDEHQIRTVLEQAKTAAELGDVTKAMQCVSKDYKDSTGNTFSSLRILAAYTLRDAKPVIHLQIRSLDIQGETATAQIHLKIDSAKQIHSGFDGDLNLRLVKEKSNRLLVFPGTRWRIISGEGLPTAHEF